MAKNTSFAPEWLKRLLSTPIEELNRWQYALRFTLELCRHGGRRLAEDRAGQMAAALAFRTIFGLVPMIIIVIMVFRMIGTNDLFANLVQQVVEAAHLQDVKSPDESQTLAAWLTGIVAHIENNINARTIGVIGLLVLAWAAISLLTTIERCFNTICQAPEHRSLGRRIQLYWTTITFGPFLLYLTFHFENKFVTMTQQAGLAKPIATAIGTGTAFVSVWLLLLGLYMFMPHTRLRLSAATAGSFIAAIFWLAATNLFGWYIAWSFSSQSSAFTILYGSLGLIPLFLLWIYFLWLVVLYGLEITTTLQFVGVRMDASMPAPRETPSVIDPVCIIPLVRFTADRFAEGLTARPDEIVESTRIPPQVVELLGNALREAGFFHEVEHEGERGYTLARPPESIRTGELLPIAQRYADVPRSSSPKVLDWLKRFQEAQLRLDVHRTLAEL